MHILKYFHCVYIHNADLCTHTFIYTKKKVIQLIIFMKYHLRIKMNIFSIIHGIITSLS